MIKKGPLVSITVPTYRREKFHERLYKSFSSQTYPLKELCILDDSPDSSSFFKSLKDQRVCYVHEKKRLSLGEKRNRLVEMGRGEIIAHFDDDDLYMPDYLNFMVKALADHAFVTLSKWFCWFEKEERFFCWDTSKRESFHILIDSKGVTKGINLLKETGSSFLEDTLWGYGFSYVYRKSLYPQVSFDPQDNFGEDLHFVKKLLKRGELCITIADEKGLVLHCLHGNNLSKVFPQFEIPASFARKVFNLNKEEL